MNRRIDIPVRFRFNAGSDSAVNGIPGAKFPKSAHLLKHADFQSVYEKGKRHFSGNLTVFFLRRVFSAKHLNTAGIDSKQASRPVNIPGPRVGFTVGRVLGGSVERNRIRRRTREAVRQYYSRYLNLPVDVIIHPKKTVLKLDFAQLSSEIERALEVVRQRTENSEGAAQPQRTSRQGSQAELRSQNSTSDPDSANTSSVKKTRQV